MMLASGSPGSCERARLEAAILMGASLARSGGPSDCVGGTASLMRRGRLATGAESIGGVASLLPAAQEMAGQITQRHARN